MVELSQTVGGLDIRNMESPVEIHQVLVSLRSVLWNQGIELSIQSDAKDGKPPTQIFVKVVE
ncbi:MAG: hypothetical protein N2V78_09460 [Methanophagales archaeon]|nr:hypothetical protein [Methanophagales archaeon]